MNSLRIPDQFLTLPPAALARLQRLPAFVQARIYQPPVKGRGHPELYRDASVMKRARLTDTELEGVLRARYANFYRPVADRDYELAIQQADGGFGRAAPSSQPAEAPITTSRANDGAPLSATVAHAALLPAAAQAGRMRGEAD